MKDNPFAALTANALRMADELVEFELQTQSDPFELRLSETEIIVELEDVLPDPITGVLTHKGKTITLFIPDHSYGIKFNKVKNGSLNYGNKFHISHCSTLEAMKNNNRLDRYAVNEDKENLYTITNNQDEKYRTKLLVCTNCLTKLNYKNYNHSDKNNTKMIRNNFDFNEFLQEYTTNFNELPEYVGQDRGGYTSDWVSISTSYRASKNYTCEQCGVNLISRKGLLHTHHKNGVKHDNNYNNLEALCIVCHGDQPFHGHMRSWVEKYRAAILALRRAQNLPTRS